MHVTLAALALLLDGAVDGDAQTVVNGVAPIAQARPGDLTYITARKYSARLAESQATAVLVDLSLPVDRPAIRVSDPLQALMTLLVHFFPWQPPDWHIDPRAVVASDVVLGNDVNLGPYVVIGPGACLGDRVTVYPGTSIGEACEIGADSILYANVSLYARVSLGQRVIVHSGAVIGADGFGFAPTPEGVYRKIPQVGRVRIGDAVEIGANTCIDRAMVGDTIIETGVKLDNLVQIGHNTTVAAHTVLAGQVGLAGSVQVGSGVRMGGQAGVADHITIGTGASIAAQSGVRHDVEPGTAMFGSPAVPSPRYKRMHFYSLRLGELFQQIKQLQRRLDQLEQLENKA
ncbi:UDP-3-O-(3-hydroxymyristoyl)glucosamine N-acyltransferase [Candidatus Entotheonellaceae bacterium PAL068K]